MPETPTQISIASLNANGLRDAQKRSNLFRLIRHQRIDLAAIQDTRFHEGTDDAMAWSGPLGIRGLWTGETALFIINPAITIESHEVIGGRISVAILKIRSHSIRFISVYAPASPTARNNFFRDTFSRLPPHPFTLMLGDFNTYASWDLDRYPPRPTKNSWGNLATELQRLKVVDAFRYHSPEGRQYTFERKETGSKSRLDYIFASPALLSSLQCPYTVPCAYSDHHLLCSSLRLAPADSHGPGEWRLDTSLLTDESFCQRIKGHLKDIPFQHRSIIHAWEEIKMVAAAEARRRRIELREEKTWKLHALQRQWKEMAAQQPPTLEDDKNAWLIRRDTLKETIRNNQRRIIDKQRAVTRARWIEQGERPTRFFYRSMKASSIATQLDSVYGADGQRVTDIEGMLRETRGFYSRLYSAGKVSATAGRVLLSHVPRKLSPQSREALESPITQREVEETIENLPPLKAPGPDGLPNEFYKAFRKEMAPLLTELFEECARRDKLPVSYGRSRVVLLHKKKDRADLANWRPISLMNCDEKILTRILTTRLQPELPLIIGQEQSGFVRGRSIYDNIWTMAHALEASKMESVSGAMVLLDQEKAYDRVDWTYLTECLKKFGFGTHWIAWIHRLYRNLRSSYMVNGYSSVPISISQGLRQGDPLSPLLYNIVLEPLLCYLNTHLKGLPLPSLTLRTLAYADDMLVALRDQVDVGTLEHGLRLHAAACNARVNRSKSEIVKLDAASVQTSFSQIQPGQSYRYLGVLFKDQQVDSQLQQHNLVRSIEEWINAWQHRDLSLKGRVLVLNTCVLSKLWFTAHITPISNETLKTVNGLVRRFLWKGRAPKVSLERIQLPKKLGGLGLIPIAKQASSLLAKWFQRVYDPKAPPWSGLARELLNRHLSRAGWSEYDLMAGNTKKWKLRDAPPLWHGLIRAWSALGGSMSVEDTPPEVVLGSPVSLALIDTATNQPKKVKPSWRKAGIRCAFDLFNGIDSRAELQINASRSKVHGRLAQQMVRGVIRLSPMFESLKLTYTSTQVDAHTAMGGLATLAGTKLRKYKASIGRRYQQKSDVSVDSPYAKKGELSGLWKRVNSGVVTPKISSLLWAIHAGGVWTALHISRFTNKSPLCPRCKEQTESVAHALVECQTIATFWDGLFIRLSDRGRGRPTSARILTIRARTARKAPVTAFSLAIACGLWIVHRARTRLVFSNTPSTPQSLLAEWYVLVRGHLEAKRRTAVANDNLEQYQRKWHWLAEVIKKGERQ